MIPSPPPVPYGTIVRLMYRLRSFGRMLGRLLMLALHRRLGGDAGGREIGIRIRSRGERWFEETLGVMSRTMPIDLRSLPP